MREGAAAELLKQSHVDAAKDKADKGCSALSLDFKKLATETLQDYGLKLAPGAICNAAVGGFRHARQRGVVDAKDIDLEQGQVDDNHTKALPISLLDGLSAGRHYKEDLVGELVVEVVLTEIVKIDALPTEDMFPLTCSVIEQASTERSRTSSPNGRIFQFLFTVACLTATTVIAVIILLLREVAGSFRSHSCFTGAPVSLRALSGFILHLHLEANCLPQALLQDVWECQCVEHSTRCFHCSRGFILRPV